MDTMKTEYEFLDLSDVKGTELKGLQVALSEGKLHSVTTANPNWTISKIDPASSSAGGGSAESVGAEGEMSRAAPPPYAAPPPPYAPQWPVAPPNVYVSQVTANVNVHGYMGQYYQPQPQFVSQTGERQPRPHRRSERRGKRPPSPPVPAQPPPYYVQYPHYYPPPQAQGAPVYHMPMYQPLVYGPYTYPQYYPEYPMPVEGEGEKGPEEYPAEVVMEQEAVEAYYAGYGAGYGPPMEHGMEYMPSVYIPPPAHVPQHMPQHHQPTPHQFNVHAKNFVHNPNKSYVPSIEAQKNQDPQKTTPPATASAAVSVDSVPIKDLKISKGPGSPKLSPATVSAEGVAKPVSPKEGVPPVVKPEGKPTWVTPENKAPDTVSAQSVTKSFPPVSSVSTSQSQSAPIIVAQTGKPNKGPSGPFASKQSPKPISQTALSVQQNASTPKAPFGRQKRDGGNNRSPNADSDEHPRREAPLPPSKAPMPISITLPSSGQPVIISNKPPFGHSRKAALPEPAPAPPVPPPAPTASDFPPPPTPRHPVAPPPASAPAAAAPVGKSWASLFSKADEPTPSPPANKPVAKVPPFDASLLLPSEKPKPPPTTTLPSYSEKTSAQTPKPTSPSETTPKETTPHSSPFADDPHSHRIGEYLSKYQLDNRPVCLIPRGLTNRSNYCYVNAILQALVACPPFYNMLKAMPYQPRKGKSSTPIIDAMVELCLEFSPLPSNMRMNRGRGGEGSAGALPIQSGPPLDPSAGQKVLRSLRPFPGSQEGRQEDAEEFLSCLLNGLNDEMLELLKLVEPEESRDPNQVNGVQDSPPEEDDEDDEWKVMGPRNRGAIERRWLATRTPLADMFRGRTRQRLHRAIHKDVTDAVQPFFTLQLDIERATSVKDALDLLAGKDTLEGESDAWQQLSIEQLPVVLLLHLKCFQLDADGHTAKIVKNIDFPVDLKIDQKIMSSKQKYTPKQRTYKLFAVVYHEGVEAVKGHYLTDTYHGQAGWIRYDDSTVTLVNETQVLKTKPPRMPYILMYRRQDTLPAAHRPKPE